MARTIDADALMDNIRKHCIIPGWCYPLIELEINDAPTIEAVPVHGEWIKETVLSKCSVCGFRLGADTYRYCPNCGAKMDGKAV